MSVEIVDFKNSVEPVHIAQHAGPRVKKNFFDVFGTTGCLLNCQTERTLEQDFQQKRAIHVPHSDRKNTKANSARKKHSRRVRRSRQEWFTANDIAASVAQGCGSCSALNHIIRDSFTGNEQGLSGQYEYSVSLDFELKRRPLGKEEPLERIQLFQPPGM